MIPGNHRLINVPGSGDSLRHPLRRQPTSEGHVKAIKSHVGEAKHILRYLAGTMNFDIKYKNGRFAVAVFSDANWGNNPDDRAILLYQVDFFRTSAFLSPPARGLFSCSRLRGTQGTRV